MNSWHWSEIIVFHDTEAAYHMKSESCNLIRHFVEDCFVFGLLITVMISKSNNVSIVIRSLREIKGPIISITTRFHSSDLMCSECSSGFSELHFGLQCWHTSHLVTCTQTCFMTKNDFLISMNTSYLSQNVLQHLVFGSGKWIDDGTPAPLTLP